MNVNAIVSCTSFADWDNIIKMQLLVVKHFSKSEMCSSLNIVTVYNFALASITTYCCVCLDTLEFTQCELAHKYSAIVE